MIIFYGVIFLCGCIMGGFLNVCIFKIPKGQSIVYSASYCSTCGEKIRFYDLIPIISYIILRGKCRYCSEKISVRYLLIEFITGVNFLIIYFLFGLNFEFFKYVSLICVLIVITMIDLDTRNIYFKTTLSGFLLASIFIILSQYLYSDNCFKYLYGGLLGGGIISLIIIFTGNIGWGIAELSLMVGAFLGFKLTFIMLILAFILGGIIEYLLLVSKIKIKNNYVPFGACIALGSIITILCKQKIILVYSMILH